MEAAKVARTRMQSQEELEDAWGAAVPMDDDFQPGYGGEEDERWDSDADYDQEEDIAEFY
jgi:hypothetical protein